jgi:hypothetical protein
MQSREARYNLAIARNEALRLSGVIDDLSNRLDETKCAQMVLAMEREVERVKSLNEGQAETIAGLVADRKMLKAQLAILEKTGS